MVSGLARKTQVNLILCQIAEIFSQQQTDTTEDDGEKQHADDKPGVQTSDRYTQCCPCGGRMLSIDNDHNKDRQSNGKGMNPRSTAIEQITRARVPQPIARKAAH